MRGTARWASRETASECTIRFVAFCHCTAVREDAKAPEPMALKAFEFGKTKITAMPDEHMH